MHITICCPSRLQIFKVTPRRLLLTFVGEPYPRVDAVGCVSSAQQSKIQQHQCQIHSPYALSHPYEDTHSTANTEILKGVHSIWAAKSIQRMTVLFPASSCK